MKTQSRSKGLQPRHNGVILQHSSERASEKFDLISFLKARASAGGAARARDYLMRQHNSVILQTARKKCRLAEVTRTARAAAALHLAVIGIRALGLSLALSTRYLLPARHCAIDNAFATDLKDRQGVRVQPRNAAAAGSFSFGWLEACTYWLQASARARANKGFGEIYPLAGRRGGVDLGWEMEIPAYVEERREGESARRDKERGERRPLRTAGLSPADVPGGEGRGPGDGGEPPRATVHSVRQRRAGNSVRQLSLSPVLVAPRVQRCTGRSAPPPRSSECASACDGMPRRPGQ